MTNFLLGLFIVLHGLVHLWYVILSQGLVEYQPAMGWTSESWLLSPILSTSANSALAGMLHGLATVALLAGGVGLVTDAAWWRPVLLGAAAFSAVIIILFWDGNFAMLVEKGLLGLLINVIIMAVLLLRI